MPKTTLALAALLVSASLSCERRPSEGAALEESPPRPLPQGPVVDEAEGEDVGMVEEASPARDAEQR